jgi:hypothetical protein
MKSLFFSKKGLSFILALVLSLFSFVSLDKDVVLASGESDFSVSIQSSKKATPDGQLSLTISVTDIIYPQFDEGKGIFGVALFVYYDNAVLTPAENGFSAIVPKNWDSFGGTSTEGVWGLYGVFDGDLSNGATDDGDISFDIVFDVSANAKADETYVYVANCECTGYKASSIVKVNSYDSTAYCEESIEITLPQVLIPKDNAPFTIDMENGIIYADTPDVDFDTFVSHFSEINGELTISAFDYVITSDNGKYIPAGAIINVYHEATGQTISLTYYLLGDCDSNGRINVTDLAVIKSVILNNIETDGYLKYAMEFEKDGVIRLADYLRLKAYLLSR